MLYTTLFWLLPAGWALECYDSSYPTPHKTKTCEPNMLCYSEFYAVNRSGTVRSYHDRFCVHEKLCLSRNIIGCRNLDDLAPKIQKAFVKYHVRTVARQDILAGRFCCCDDDLCNTSPSLHSLPFLLLFSLFYL